MAKLNGYCSRYHKVIMLRTFETDRLYGLKKEIDIRELMLAAGAFISKMAGDNKNDFSVVYMNLAHRVEVKCEDRYKDSGNLCIEVSQGRTQKSSGIVISEATLFIHTLGDNCVVYRRAKLYEWLRNSYHAQKIKLSKFGDNHNQGFILPITSLLVHKDWFDFRPTATIAQCPLWLA